MRAVHEEIIVRSPAEVAQHLMRSVFHPFAAFEQEELWCLLLNNKNRITHEAMIYRGTINQVQIRLAEVFRPAIRYNAALFLLAHNHPSSDPTPSQEDIRFSEEAREMGQKLGLDLLDHIIIGHNRYISLKEQGLAFGA